MAWTSPSTFIAGTSLTAAQMNIHARDNPNALRAGGIAISGQTADDLIVASSGTQLGRLAASEGKMPLYTSGAWLMATLYPVGSLYFNGAVSTNPATLLGFGTWVAHASGQVLVGVDAGQSEFASLGQTGGAKTHTLITGEIPAHAHPGSTASDSGHTHGVGYVDEGSGPNSAIATVADLSHPSLDGTVTSASGNANISLSIASQGGGGAHNNLQPYITVYCWRRTA